MEIHTSVAPLRDDLTNIYALLFRFLGYSFRLAMSNVGWLATQQFVILVPDLILFAPWPVLLDRGEPCHSLLTRHTTTCRSKVWVVDGVDFPCVPPPITSPSAAEAARGGEHEGRPRLDEEVLGAPEELRQPVVGVGGAQEDQGQERFAL